MRYTQKQIDKFNRQKYIVELEKISKNLFRMFRDENVVAQDFVRKFGQLKKKFDEKVEVHLESEYHQQLKEEYIVRIHERTCLVEIFTDKECSNIREAEMSNLNR